MFFESIKEKRYLRSLRRQLERGNPHNVRNVPKHLRKDIIKQEKLRAEVNQKLEACGGQLDDLYANLCNQEHDLLVSLIGKPDAENELAFQKIIDMMHVVEADCIAAYMAEHGWKLKVGRSSVWVKE